MAVIQVDVGRENFVPQKFQTLEPGDFPAEDAKETSAEVISNGGLVAGISPSKRCH